MIGKRRGLALLGTTAVCLAILGSTTVSDSRLTSWMSAFGELKANLRNTFQPDAATETKIANKAADAAVREDDKLTGKSTENAPADAETGAATEKAEAAKNAYKTAVADERIRALGFEPTGILDAITAYRADNLAAGDIIAAQLQDPLVRSALEWVALREVPQKIGLARLQAFIAKHPGWPSSTFLRTQMEARLLGVKDPLVVQTFFAESAPVTPLGKLALARALKATGRVADGAKLARSVFRETDLNGFSETLLKTEFGGDLTKNDYKYRADRLLYKEKVVPALRYAAEAGPDVLALAKARAAVIAETPGDKADKAIAAVPDALRNDPGLILAEVQKLRRADKLLEAAKLMESAPHDAGRLVDGDEWWTERRVLARKLLDAGKVNAAYIMCAMSTPVTREAKVEAQFHAGWIGLRFLHEPARAAYHFGMAAKLAETPTSIARVAYWQARTAEAVDDATAKSNAQSFYSKAALHGSTYYGQLARQVLGETQDPVHRPAYSPVGDQRAEAVRVVELLYAANEKDAAYSLALGAASGLEDPDQVGALAAVIDNQQDAHLALTIGKLAAQRGMPVDTLAFPTNGIPTYTALQGSAPTPVVYAVARQESAFMPTVISKAGAKGLMQMIDTTAKQTATKAGLPFDSNRMLTDAAFNAQLGAAHLGELIAAQNGSLILTFAAYNAGPGRVKQWIDAYGDPRKPGIDPVDWVERIPFTETRNYVQRVTANVTMYQAIFDDQAKAVAAKGGREAKL